MVYYSTSLPLSLSLHRRAPNMSLTFRKTQLQRHISRCEMCTPLVHRVTPRAGKKTFHREQFLSTSLLLHLNPQHIANPHPAPAKQFQIMAGVTPIATQCKSDLCTAQSPPQDKQHLAQMAPTWQTLIKMHLILPLSDMGQWYGNLSWEEKYWTENFKQILIPMEIFSIQIQLTYSRPERYKLPLMIQNNLVATCFMTVLDTENGEDHTSSSAQGQQIKRSSGRCISSRIVKALAESWTRKLMMYCGYSKFT